MLNRKGYTIMEVFLICLILASLVFYGYLGFLAIQALQKYIGG